MRSFMMPTPERCFLLLVDFQERLLRAVGDRAPIVLRGAKVLLETANTFGLPLLQTEQYPQGLGRTHPELMPPKGDDGPLEKIHFSVWREPTVRERIQGLDRDQVFLGGIEAHVCVLQSALDLLDNGYEVWVAADAVASRTKTDLHHGLRILEGAGAYIATSEILAFWFLKRAGTEQFKRLSRALR